MVDFHEELDLAAFRSAWQEITERHAILRTGFLFPASGAPSQRVYSGVSLPWKEHDWRGKSSTEQKTLFQSFLEVDRAQGFELNCPPLVRLTLFHLADADFRLVWTSHHAILDGRSRLLVLRELFARYEMIRVGQKLTLPSPRPYRDFIDWFGRQDWNAANGFWKETLSGYRLPTTFEIDHWRSRQGAEINFGKQATQLSQGLTSALKKLGQRHQITLNNLLQGAWSLLLNRYSGEPDVVFGAPRSGRYTTVAGADSIVGLLINTVPVRVRVSPEMYLVSWLKEIRDQWVAIRPFEHTPLVEIQQSSELPPGTQLFESLVVFENYELNDALRAQGGQWEKRDFQVLGRTNYPLTLTGYLSAELSLEISYDLNRFDDATVSRMLGHLQTLLTSIVADPNQRLSELAILTEAEKNQLFVEWNDTKREYPKDKCIHQLFEKQVEKSPDAVAVVFEEQQLSYQELNRRANQLAHYLRRRGVGAETLVALCVERSIEMVVGVLAVLKAGGAYVPMDPEYPRDRLEFMLSDTQASVLLTQERLSQMLPEYSGQKVRFDQDWPEITRESEANLGDVVAANNLAYVIYTSGSTGKPKGVMIQHGSAVNFLTSMAQEPGMTNRDTLLAVTTLSFDIAGLEIYLPLSVGGRVVMVNREVAADGVQLAKQLSDFGATMMQATPATWRMLLTSGWQGSEQLKILCGGEALPDDLANELVHRCASLWNMYGPTETTIWSAVQRVAADFAKISLGRPIDNTQVYILDSHLNPVPIGVSGELYIGGAGLARGYLNRPELSAEKFVQHPFSDTAGARLYRSGDLARYLPDGNIEYLGRIDNQVKIRGFRIELGEIETVLHQHPAVRECVVVACEEQSRRYLLLARD